jgi:hypothetical protein
MRHAALTYPLACQGRRFHVKPAPQSFSQASSCIPLPAGLENPSHLAQAPVLRQGDERQIKLFHVKLFWYCTILLHYFGIYV